MKDPHKIKRILIKSLWLTIAAFVGFKYAEYIAKPAIDKDTQLELIGGYNVLILLMILEGSIAGIIHLFVKKEN